MEVTQLPFNRLVGLERGADDSEFLVCLPDNPEYANHLGTVHASALLAAAEAGSGAFLVLPKYTLGGIGGILSCAHLKTTYPAVAALVVEIHEKRSKSALSHPVKAMGKARTVVGATGRVKFSYLNRARKLVRAALKELAGMKKW